MTGERVGSYLVGARLREGGVATFYEATDEQSGRRVIAKILNRDVSSDGEIRHRFLSEARAVALLQHPAILAVLAVGEWKDGLLYIVTERPNGESLFDRQRRLGGPLGLAVVPLFQEIARALALAHGKGIVHRNLKPDSLFVVADEEGAGGEHVKIADFGLAKLPKKPAVTDEEAFETSDGATIGTPVYMAPELYGSAGKAEGRADVYSLGIVLYEALAGRPPFESPSPAEIIGMHMFRPPPPLSEAAPTMPPALSALVHAMLAKEPEQRPTMDAVAERLGRPDAPVAPQPAPPGFLQRLFGKRR